MTHTLRNAFTSCLLSSVLVGSGYGHDHCWNDSDFAPHNRLGLDHHNANSEYKNLLDIRGVNIPILTALATEIGKKHTINTINNIDNSRALYSRAPFLSSIKPSDIYYNEKHEGHGILQGKRIVSSTHSFIFNIAKPVVENSFCPFPVDLKGFLANFNPLFPNVDARNGFVNEFLKVLLQEEKITAEHKAHLDWAIFGKGPKLPGYDAVLNEYLGDISSVSVPLLKGDENIGNTLTPTIGVFDTQMGIWNDVRKTELAIVEVGKKTGDTHPDFTTMMTTQANVSQEIRRLKDVINMMWAKLKNKESYENPAAPTGGEVRAITALTERKLTGLQHIKPTLQLLSESMTHLGSLANLSFKQEEEALGDALIKYVYQNIVQILKWKTDKAVMGTTATLQIQKPIDKIIDQQLIPIQKIIFEILLKSSTLLEQDFTKLLSFRIKQYVQPKETEEEEEIEEVDTEDEYRRITGTLPGEDGVMPIVVSDDGTSMLFEPGR